jgi:protein gp37
MAENSGIEWTHHTFNPWIGCTKVSPACDHCYAEAWNQRYEGGKNWGPKAPRRRTSEKNWNMPLKWEKEAVQSGQRFRVFCASLADVFDSEVDPAWRSDLWALIRKTPNLDWLLLTKRPQNIKKMLPEDWADGYKNVWLGTTVENQKYADHRIPHLLDNPAVVHFLSCEPLLGTLDINKYLVEDFTGDLINGPVKHHPAVSWVIAGGESGPAFRAGDPSWFLSLRDQCVLNKVPFLFKQWEGATQGIIKRLGRELEGVEWNQYPRSAA